MRGKGEIKNMASTIQGFKIMRVAFDKSVKSPHFMYFKKHTHQKQSGLMPSNKTIFVVNVPPYCTKAGLENLFERFGPINAMFIQDAPGPVQQARDDSSKLIFSKDIFSFKVAYVVFKKPNSVEHLMRSNLPDIYYMSEKKKVINTGMKKWCMEYRQQYPNPKETEKKADKFMAQFDLEEARKKAELERLANEPDEEGWTVVTHGKKNLGDAQMLTKRERQKRQRKELVNFYTFQQRESKREHIAVLRKKFEEDKQKIQLMRAARKFKPF